MFGMYYNTHGNETLSIMNAIFDVGYSLSLRF